MTNNVRSNELPADATAPPAFARVLCGVDGSEGSSEAVRQCVRLASRDTRIDLLAVLDHWNPIAGANVDGALLDAVQQCANHSSTTQVRHGWAPDVLVQAARERAADLIGLGMHAAGRRRGALGSSVASHVLHHAACSVLLARRGSPGWPSSIVVGTDGSRHAARAVAVALQLGEAFSAPVRCVSAVPNRSEDTAGLPPGTEVSVGKRPDLILVGKCSADDLLVVGSRGRRGIRALGSTSERVAHQAPCSVLVVRGALDRNVS